MAYRSLAIGAPATVVPCLHESDPGSATIAQSGPDTWRKRMSDIPQPNHFNRKPIVAAILGGIVAVSSTQMLMAGTNPPAVKELFGMGETVRGWAVSLKLDGTSAGGSRWYWFEYFDGRVVADARGAPLCAGCHAAGRDFVLIPWPLQ